MNLVFHQLKKDIRRTRVVLTLWLALVVLQFALVGWNVQPGDALMQSLYQLLSGILMFFNYLIVLVLVPLLVHQEPLVGTTAFWSTRPLARADLLASKALYVLLLVTLPVLAQSVVFLANGVTFHDALIAALQLLLSQTCWILIVATLAVLTPNFARFAIVGAVILILWWLSIICLQLMESLRNPWYASTPASLTTSQSEASSFLMMGFGAGVVLLQYLGRRFRFALGFAITGACLSSLTAYLWPWDFLKSSVHVVQDSSFNAATVTAALTYLDHNTDRPGPRGGAPLKEVRENITFKGNPKGYVFYRGPVDAVLRSADGRKIPLQQSNEEVGSSGVRDADAIELGLGGAPILNMTQTNPSLWASLDLEAETYRRYASTPLHYSASFDCTAYKYVVAAELPLTKGARFDHGSEHVIVTDVLNQSDGIDVLLRRRNVNLLFAPRDPIQDVTVYVLLNKARRQAVIQKPDNSYSYMADENILRNEPQRLSFGPDDRDSPPNWLAPKLDKAWLADAVLVRLNLVPVAIFARKLDIPGFRLDGDFPLPGSHFQRRMADLKDLDQITLPHDATREQVRTYITDILTASRRTPEAPHDPQIDMLEKVGAQNVDLLIEMARDNHNFYLNRAINDLAQPDHKEMVIEAFATNHDLLDTIFDHGWRNDAKSTLLEVFADKNRDYPNSWVVAVAALKDPCTYDSLEKYYIARPSEDVFKALQALPNFNLAQTVDLAWKDARTGQPWQLRNLLQPAAQFGEPDVPEVIVNILKKKEPDNYLNQRARLVLKQYTPAMGATDDELIAWYATNGANLVFDHQAGKYVVKPPIAPTPPVKTAPR